MPFFWLTVYIIAPFHDVLPAIRYFHYLRRHQLREYGLHHCLSVCFSGRHLKNRRSYTTYKCSKMNPGNPCILWSKGQGHNVCVGPQTERNIAAAAYARHAGFSLLLCTAAQAMIATPRFSCVTSPRPLAAGHWVFPGVGVCTLVAAGVF